MDAAEERSFGVVLNQHGQYSIWPSNKSLPPGWRLVGMAGTKAACLAHIAQVWIDMRPPGIASGYRDPLPAASKSSRHDGEPCQSAGSNEPMGCVPR